MGSSLTESAVNSVRTVSDTKRTFYNIHTRPVNSIYRRVVDELMVEMHLLAVNLDFRYDPIYALGVVTTFDRFMQGYRPEADQESIFKALCQALQYDPHQFRQDAQQLLAVASRFPWESLFIPEKSAAIPDAAPLRTTLNILTDQPKFKYSRLFAIGIYTLLETSSPEVAKDESKRTEALTQICQGLNVPDDKLLKDLELYRSNLEKMAQAQVVLADALAADRKKREERAQAQAAKTETTEPKDEAPSES